MAVFNKFDSFVEALAEKQHDLGADSLMVALTNTAPTAGNTQLTNITQISYTNLPTSRVLSRASSSQTGGLYSLVINDLTLTASGGAVATFRYVVVYNDTSTNDLLIGWYDYGAGGVTMQDGETFTLDFGASLLTLQ